MNVNWIYCAVYFTIYTNVDLLCYTPDTNVMLYVNCISVKKLSTKKREMYKCKQ